MVGDKIQAERLQQSEGRPEPESEELAVEKSYKENNSGNAQEAVESLMSNMDFLQREGDLVYVVPEGTDFCMHG